MILIRGVRWEIFMSFMLSFIITTSGPLAVYGILNPFNDLHNNWWRYFATRCWRCWRWNMWRTNTITNTKTHTHANWSTLNPTPIPIPRLPHVQHFHLRISQHLIQHHVQHHNPLMNHRRCPHVIQHQSHH